MSFLLASDVSADEARRQEWLARRREVVTSTDVPVLFGQGYSGSSPVLLHAQKRGLAPQSEPSLRMMIGRWMEPVIRQAYQHITGRTVTAADPWALHVSTKYPWLAASLDGVDSEGVLTEMKNSSDYMKDESDIPGGWYLQIQTQLLVTERPVARLVVLCRSSDLAIFEIKPNPEMQAEIVKRSRLFYEMLKSGAVPAPTCPEDNDAYKYVYAANPEATVELDPDDYVPLGEEREAINAQIKELEERKAMIEGKVKFALGEAEAGLMQDEGGWYWKADKNGRRRLYYRGRKA